MKVYFIAALAAISSVFNIRGEETTPLQKQFSTPPSEFRLLPIEHGVRATAPEFIKWLHDRDAGGAVIDASRPLPKGSSTEPWVNPAYLNNPESFSRLREMTARLKAEGLQIWIYDELGYPSGSAGGRVLQDHPEYAVQAVRCRTLRTSGEPLEIAMQGSELIQCRALPENNGILDLSRAVDLSEKARAGRFTWSPPTGSGAAPWTVCLFERYVPDTWKRHNIARRNVNIMDRRVVSRFIELTHERYAKELGPQLNDVFLIFTDEPQLGAVEPWMNMAKKSTPPAVQWCDELPTAFLKKKGYPITDALAALFHDAGPATARYRYDFYDIYSDLIAENYYGQIEEWCHAHKIFSSGHMLLEESLLFHPMFSGSMVKNWARQDLPGVDQLVLPRYKTMGGWNGNVIPVKEDFSVKMAASIATLTGKQGVFSESFALADRAKPADMARSAKGIAAWQFACGVTHMCTYTLQQSVTPEKYAQVSDFTGRLALLCRRGRAVSDVAVLVPEASVWAFYNPPDGGTFGRYMECNPEVMQIDNAFRETCHQLLENQRDFEVITEQLLSKARVKDGRVELAGQSFAFLMLPEARMLSDVSMQKIEDFAASGGHVVFTGSLPSLNPARGVDESIQKRAEAMTESHAERVRFFSEEKNFAEVTGWMNKRVPPQVAWRGPHAVRLARQREPEREIILIANPGDTAVDGSLVSTFGGSASIWNPENGDIQETGTKKSGEAIVISIPADSARFVVFE